MSSNRDIPLRFCIKAVCLWEALSGRSYQTLDLKSEEEVWWLLYAMYLAERDNEPQPLERFLKVLQGNEDIGRIMLEQAKEALLVSQDLSARLSEKPDSKALEASDESKPIRISDVVARLVVECGISAEYVYYDMGLWELPTMLKALEGKRAEQMERERLWCFFSLLPHVSKDSIKKPQDLIRFPHERADEVQAEAEQDALYSFFAGGGGVH